ncbi:FRG domain-containing protein [Niallia taxi]|nr:FRG domain-containing protein [Niallia taxi]MDE5051741.1 FRG domain-containing protein [Niallia taxi]
MVEQIDGSFRAKNWIDLQEELFKFEIGKEHGRYRSSFLYRGVDSYKFDLETSLMRIKNPDMESHLLRNFQKYARSTLKDNNNIWELLSVAQHYGLPTRLLDWSFSPYVALHFATSDTSKYNVDGAIWCLDIMKVQELLPTAYKDELDRVQSNVFTVDMLKKIVNPDNAVNTMDLTDFDCSKSSDDFIICLEPPSMDERIVNQYAIFTVMTNPNRKLNDLLIDKPEMYKKIIIPKELKLEIRDKLDQANMNERMIYPGLQGISAWLKRYFTNKELLQPKD